MIKTCNPNLQEKLEQYIQESGSQTKAAAMIGYSTATLSTYRSGKYIGDVEKLEAKLEELFSIKENSKDFYTLSNFVPTSISKQVYETIRICHLKGGLAIECGDAGIGKTKAAKKYAKDYPNSTIYLTVNPCLVSITAFLKLLCRQLKIPTTGHKDDMWLDVDSQLRGSKKVLIIDEAQHLPIKTIDSIRALFDNNPKLGIIFIGNEETITNRTGSNKASFRQVTNRTRFTEIRRTSHFTKDDVRLLFPKLAEGHMERELDFLLAICQSDQGVRGAVNVYSNATDNENITYDGLIAMSRSMKMVV